MPTAGYRRRPVEPRIDEISVYRSADRIFVEPLLRRAVRG